LISQTNESRAVSRRVNVIDGPSSGTVSSAQACDVRRPQEDLPLDTHCDAHAAADAERREPLLDVALLHLVEQRHEHPRPGSADRMSDRDGAAVDVDFGGIPTEIL